LLPGEESIPYHYDFVDKNQFGDFAIHVGEAQRYTVIFVGCATYKSPTDSATHQSGVVFTMIGDKAPIDPQRDHQIDTSEPLPKVEIIRDYTAGPAN
jgi:hypothetical protein